MSINSMRFGELNRDNFIQEYNDALDDDNFSFGSARSYLDELIGSQITTILKMIMRTTRKIVKRKIVMMKIWMK